MTDEPTGKRADRIKGFADGGLVSGPAGTDPDRIPAFLSDGCIYVGGGDTAKNRRLLDAINAGVFPPGPPVVVAASFTLTNNLSGPRLSPLPQVASGRFDVSGSLMVHFHNAALIRAMRQGQRRLNRRALRVFRPHLSKRAYRRLRGRMKGNRR